jgi:hypothetical protein
VEISELGPDGGDLPGEHFDVRRFKVGVIGPYHRVAAFMAHLGAMERVMVPLNLRMKVGPPTVQGRKPQPNEVFILAQFTLQTYVARTTARSATDAGGQND